MSFEITDQRLDPDALKNALTREGAPPLVGVSDHHSESALTQPGPSGDRFSVASIRHLAE